MSICIEVDSSLNYFQFISIRSCTKMPMLSTLCITGKLELFEMYNLMRRPNHSVWFSLLRETNNCCVRNMHLYIICLCIYIFNMYLDLLAFCKVYILPPIVRQYFRYLLSHFNIVYFWKPILFISLDFYLISKWQIHFLDNTFILYLSILLINIFTLLSILCLDYIFMIF